MFFSSLFSHSIILDKSFTIFVEIFICKSITTLMYVACSYCFISIAPDRFIALRCHKMPYKLYKYNTIHCVLCSIPVFRLKKVSIATGKLSNCRSDISVASVLNERVPLTSNQILILLFQIGVDTRLSCTGLTRILIFTPVFILVNTAEACCSCLTSSSIQYELTG